MKFYTESLLLYAITDRTWLGGKTFCEAVEESVLGGATILQLREKNLPYEEFLKLAIKIKLITDKYNIPFIINDNIDVALACNADGVHVGQSDMYSGRVRKIIGENKILGVSAQTVAEAVEAEKNGADYIGVGAMFSTSTKSDATTVNFDTLKNIVKSISIPVVAIGGINENNIMQLKNCGIAGVSVISAIYSKSDILFSTQKLYEMAKQIVQEV